MKNFIKALTFVFVCSLVTVACSNDDDPKPVKLESVSYAKKTGEVAKDAVFASEAIKVVPTKATASYKIKSITKNGKAFTNPSTGFKIATDGKLSLAKGNKLEAAKYVVTIEATDKADAKVKKTTTFTLTIKSMPVKLESVSYAKKTGEVAKDAVFTSEAIKVVPTKATASYKIKSITKNAKAFTNPSTGFKIATDGKLSLAKGNKLEKAKYIVTIEATDKEDTKVKKTTTFTLTIK